MLVPAQTAIAVLVVDHAGIAPDTPLLARHPALRHVDDAWTEHDRRVIGIALGMRREVDEHPARPRTPAEQIPVTPPVRSRVELSEGAAGGRLKPEARRVRARHGRCRRGILAHTLQEVSARTAGVRVGRAKVVARGTGRPCHPLGARRRCRSADDQEHGKRCQAAAHAPPAWTMDDTQERNSPRSKHAHTRRERQKSSCRAPSPAAATLITSSRDSEQRRHKTQDGSHAQSWRGRARTSLASCPSCPERGPRPSAASLFNAQCWRLPTMTASAQVPRFPARSEPPAHSPPAWSPAPHSSLSGTELCHGEQTVATLVRGEQYGGAEIDAHSAKVPLHPALLRRGAAPRRGRHGHADERATNSAAHRDRKAAL